MSSIGSRACEIVEVLILLVLQTFVGDCLLTALCNKTPDL